jgi:hypothetical protein
MKSRSGLSVPGTRPFRHPRGHFLEDNVTVIKGRVDRASPMGATLTADGTAFRTWTPNARSVAVVAGDALGVAVKNSGWQRGSGDALRSGTAPGPACCKA